MICTAVAGLQQSRTCKLAVHPYWLLVTLNSACSAATAACVASSYNHAELTGAWNACLADAIVESVNWAWYSLTCVLGQEVARLCHCVQQPSRGGHTGSASCNHKGRLATVVRNWRRLLLLLLLRNPSHSIMPPALCTCCLASVAL
jgi:hypothetical protein